MPQAPRGRDAAKLDAHSQVRGDLPSDLNDLLGRIRACRLCAAALPHDPRPVLRAAPGARVMLIGQAPGTAVHASGVPWDDPSGRRLRDWLGVDADTFYDPARFAIVPMGFCYPGKGRSGDLPPRPECAPAWHPALWERLPNIRMTLLIGTYAQARYLPAHKGRRLTDVVAAWRDFLPSQMPLPHPSPRNQRWLRRNPWFEADVVPALRDAVAAALA